MRGNGQPALVDLSGVDLEAPDLQQDESVMGWALTRRRREGDEGTPGYASFINDTVLEGSRRTERGTRAGGTA
ncbi:hypothetical protein [Actinoallomurus iriomotensis]|uniref:Uncharacterized protein n=1 Tax=Actinoallomurus iriomotensis TaxID=478107 RepID=A0A9W6RQJ7_9ACTN|nr:hypothetical protein [Actinoallomurus iriomotensis]GLY80666.1 hypothetical protein Airi01_089330 [Actinoallomurus iriomotensis]